MIFPSFHFGRRSLAFVHDVAAAAVSFLLAFYLRLGDEVWGYTDPGLFAFSLLLYTGICAAVFYLSGLYRGIWAFASVRDMTAILRASVLSVFLFAIVGFITTRLEGIPRTVPVIAWLLLMLGLGGSRMAFRVWRERRLSAIWERCGGRRVNVLLVGAGDEADLFIRAVNANPQAPFRIVGVLGENGKRVGRAINGVEVLGTLSDLAEVVGKLRGGDKAPTRLILTRSTTRLNGALVAKLLEEAPGLGLSLSRLPALTDLKNDVAAGSIKEQPIALEDLLGRPETVLNYEEIARLIRGRSVIVTGAGGSIGSELVRQIAALEPSRLTLLEISEFNLYKIELEIREKFPDLSLNALIGDVRDVARLTQVFGAAKPALVFHAAAIKHVPIAEFNARETVLTNVIGSRNVADAAVAAGALALVQISTDKAVNPTNVMGAAKRLAEMYCQSLDLTSGGTRILTVRFGNVLGSTGSVVPRFQDQLAKGGPLTVTHPEIIRYFMTIREAVELVLQASTLSTRADDPRGEVMVLDMGSPVKIADLARQMIRLAGLRPDEDVKIVYTGLRPGEKLYEELFADGEERMPAGVEGVRLAKSCTVDLASLRAALDGFAAELRQGMAEEAVVARLSALVPTFVHKKDAAA